MERRYGALRSSSARGREAAGSGWRSRTRARPAPVRRVLLVDDHPLFRQALAATIRMIDDTIAIEQFETLGALTQALGHTAASNDRVALILLDLALPDCQGIAGFLSIRSRVADIPVAIISASDDPATVRTVATCGATGFISKGAGIDELTAAIRELLAGQRWFSQSAATPERGPLTSTQARILDGVHRGLMNKQIAAELNLTEATIKYHLTGIFRSLGVETRSQLLALSAFRAATE